LNYHVKSSITGKSKKKLLHNPAVKDQGNECDEEKEYIREMTSLTGWVQVLLFPAASLR